MVDEADKTAVIFLVLDDDNLKQVIANILQVKERGATIIAISNVENLDKMLSVDEKIDYLIEIFACKSILSGLQCTIPLLMLCYYTALAKGINPDQNITRSINFNEKMNF